MEYLDWMYVSCTRMPGAVRPSGSCGFVVNVPPGTYQLRLYSNNGFTPLAISNDFTVTSNSVLPFTINPSSISPGGVVTVTWNGISNSALDFIGLYTPQSSNEAHIDWMYVSCSKTPGTAVLPYGSCQFPIPGNLPAGSYHLRFLALTVQ
jgi:hypothetical protein